MVTDTPSFAKVPPKAGNIAPTAISILETTRCGISRRLQKTQALYIAPPTRATVPKVLKKGVRSLTPWGMAWPERYCKVVRSRSAVNTLKVAYSDANSKIVMIM